MLATGTQPALRGVRGAGSCASSACGDLALAARATWLFSRWFHNALSLAVPRGSRICSWLLLSALAAVAEIPDKVPELSFWCLFILGFI